MSSKRLAIASVMLATASLLTIGGAASASQGSVPGEVTSFVNDPNGLVFQLNDLFGVGADGTGIKFTSTTTSGPLSRVYSWTPEFLAGGHTDTPVQLDNEWVTTISIDKQPIGVAVITIDPATVAPELANFTTNESLTAAVSQLPDAAYLVSDPHLSAWFSLVGATLTPIVPGGSHLSHAEKLTAYQPIAKTENINGVTAPVDQGFVAGGAVLVVVALSIIATVLVFGLRKRRGDGDGDPETVTPAP